ncbi:protein phosphatase 1 regulatory subunit 3B isoform X2 [Scleropages formosus]|uniref:Protein phosphatase 1 regulatory subunit n=1 Tax=Scleropages formosus TaxID=113540 RepID=A0A8D0CES1_SCLFO|nr:protein phosphatase 1 regulatory subunit 3B isoform X2 [Scleropages formosus]
MNCASLFSFLPHKSAMPVEFAMPMYLARDNFQCRRTSRLVKPLRPCLHPCSELRLSPQPPHQQQTGSNKENGKTKKQVSFADHKGQALTMVKVFSEFDDPDIPLSIQELFTSVADLSINEDNLVLDFAQPSADYPEFRKRLDNECVCLEHCVLKERVLAGTVKVKNLAFRKCVKVRITFDTWKSYTDVECQYVRDTYTGSDRDTFSFEVSLPEQVPPHERVEFAISYEIDGHTYWDSNQGKNYRLVQSVLKNGPPSKSTMKDLCSLGVHIDRYGSPRCAHGIFPEWPSYAGYEEIGPYY